MNQDARTLFLSNAPLPQTETAVTLDVYSVEEMRTRGGEESSYTKRPEGKITFDTASIQLFAIPPHRQQGPLSLGLDRTLWDLYLVVIPFTLHKPSSNKSYTEVNFSLTLNNQQKAYAFDLFPKNIRTLEEGRKGLTISKEGRFHPTDDPDIDILAYLSYPSLEPVIHAYGVGQSNVYWTYEGSGEKKAVPTDNKNVLLVLRVPHGTRTIEGDINYTLIVNKFFFKTQIPTPAMVDPYHFQLHLQDSPLLFPKENKSRRIEEKPVDICLVCALADEAQALINIIEEQCQVKFKDSYSQQLKRGYRQTTLENERGEPLDIQVSWQVNPGPEEAALHINSFLNEFNPRFVGMTGICAGDRKKTALGDIVVAERAFSYETGKVELDNLGQKVVRPDITTWQILPELLSTVRMFDGWQTAVKQIKRPLHSRREQQDWLLAKLLETKQTIWDLNKQELEEHAPQWRALRQQLSTGASPYITPDGALTERAQELRYQEDFPYTDPPLSRVHILPVATGEKVRADGPFEEIQGTMRKAIALDTEGAAFYRTMANFSGLPALFVKGICDYADPEKDDSFHAYAAAVSAAYMLSFIRKYVNSERFPRKR